MTTHTTLRPRAERPAPLSSAQSRLYFLHELRPESTHFNLQLAFRLRGTLDIDALRGTLDEIADRHEPMRTVVELTEDGRPFQRVQPPRGLPLMCVPAPPGATPDERALATAVGELETVFDLTSAPPIRACLAAIGPDDHVFVLTLHHIMFDGWSTGVFMRELQEGYNARAAGGTPDLPELPVTYSDYAWWEQETLREQEEELLAHWRDRLDGVGELVLPADRDANGLDGAAGALGFRVDPGTLARLQGLAKEERCSLFTITLAAWQALLFRYGGGSDFVTGVATAGRTDMAVESVIGCFINTLCLRSRIQPHESFRALLARTRVTMAEALQHQMLPFERLVRELRGRENAPLYRSYCAYLEGASGQLDLDGLSSDLVQPGYQRSDFELNATFCLDEEGLLVQLIYARALFDDETSQRLGRHLSVLLDWIAVQPDRPLDEVPLLLPAERREILALLNDAPLP